MPGLLVSARAWREPDMGGHLFSQRTTSLMGPSNPEARG